MSSGPSDGTNPSAESPSPNFETVFGAIDIPALILDADGDVVVWNEPLEALLDVDRAAAEGVDEIGTMIYEDRELILAEKVCRHPETADEFYDPVAGGLTDRQQTALGHAYHNGYFSWPRGATAEEIADTMDISSPTLHYHLRQAERTLVEAYLQYVE